MTCGKINERILHGSCVPLLPRPCFTSHAPSCIHGHSQTSWSERSTLQAVRWELKASVSFALAQPQGTLRMLWILILRTDDPWPFSSSVLVSYLLETLTPGWPQAWGALSNSIPFSCYHWWHNGSFAKRSVPQIWSRQGSWEWQVPVERSLCRFPLTAICYTLPFKMCSLAAST